MQEIPTLVSKESAIIDEAWEKRDNLPVGEEKSKKLRKTIEKVLKKLDSGQLRVAEKTEQGWVVHQWVKKAILLSFRLNTMELIGGGPFSFNDEDPFSVEGDAFWYDKVPSKFSGWDEVQFKDAGFRAVPGCFVRHSAFIAKGVVLMPSFVNVGAYVGEGTMIDTWATVGSCAQIGKNCHISGGAGIGGVLEPLQANPVIIEDNCFIGARSEVAEGVIVETGSVLSMGVYIGASTKIIDRQSGEVFYGRVPAYSVVVPGSVAGKPLPDGTPGPSLYAAVVVKRVDEQTRSKTSINQLLRDLSE